MKPFNQLFALGAIVCALSLTGCSKAKKPAAAPAAPTNAAPKAAEAPKLGEKIELKTKLPAGKRLVQRTEMIMTSEMSAPGRPKPVQTAMNMSQDIALSLVAQRQGGGQEMEMEILAEKIESKVADRVMMSFDSQQDRKFDQKTPMGKDFRKLIGGKLKLLTDAVGKVEKIEGYQAFIGKATLASSPQSQGMIRSMFSEQALKQMSLSPQGMPEKTVSVGETWKAQTDMPAGSLGALKLEMTYTLKGWDQHDGRKCALVEGKGTLIQKTAAGAPGAPGAPDASSAPAVGAAAPTGVDPGAAPAPTPAAPPTKPGEIGTVSSKLWFDPEAGLVIESSTEQKMTLNIQSMSSQSTQKSISKIVEINDLKK